MKRKQRKGFTLVELMIVVGIIIILASLGVPQYVNYRENAQRAKCVSNLRVILEAKMAYAASNPGMTATIALDNLRKAGYFRGGTANSAATLKCPSGVEYDINWTEISIPYLKPKCGYTGAIKHVLGKESN